MPIRFVGRAGLVARAEVLLIISIGLETVRPYRFKDAATLIEDFWTEVDRLLREKGVIE